MLSIPQYWGMGTMLLALHAVLINGPAWSWADALLMVHYGLFLLWQPIWRGEQRLDFLPALLFVAGGAVLLGLLSWWLLAFWLAVLIGVLGGRLFSSRARRERIANMVAVGYLLTMLLAWVEPHLLKLTGTLSSAQWLVQYALPAIPVGLLFVRDERDRSPTVTLDFFYSLLLFLLVVILVLGSFIIETVIREDYVLVLMRAMFAIAGVLVALSWLWNPRAGFTGLGALLSRYLLSVGMPFEKWLQRIALLAETSSSATHFLHASAEEVASLPWVSGGTWQTDTSGGKFGETSPHEATFSYHGLRLTLYTRNTLSPALTLHIKLLAQLLGEFHEAKLREEQLRSSAYLQAVYETGARMTHDIKNLLQSLTTLCSAAEHTEDGDQARLVALMRRQLPQLTQRLQITMDKLQTPQSGPASTMNAITWWNRLRQRYRDAGVEFSSEKIMPGTVLPAELFDSVADNVLQNALEKRKSQPDLNILVILHAGNAPGLSIEDDGVAIPAATAQTLFKSPLPSASGLGIGLYQAARHAQQQDYQLVLGSNRPGAVKFELNPR
ncbi:MAG TPA: sensor histidine kinase [Novimethylophilus sp.]|uniref:sensor histidine kinase n=1 Tax=Novimethylophilus sp. TaxID=2137426 RepID=UPI002F40FA7C